MLQKITSSLRSSGRILYKSLNPEKPIRGQVSTIIATIHEERFSPRQPYCITGGHFSDLYVRNSGIFYNALLDGRIALNSDDWKKRVDIAFRTTESILRALRSCGKLYTTFSFKKNGEIIGSNFYREPSDSLHGLLWNICAFFDESFISHIFPSQGENKYTLSRDHQQKMHQLFQEYRPDIERVFVRYTDFCMSKKKYRISKKILLASARDGVKRHSAFYDNVIYWRTAMLMKKLGFENILSNHHLTKIKNTILSTFWDKERGIFLDDLSRESLTEPYFCADSLIALSAGFLDISDSKERKYFERMIEYVEQRGLDQPFGVHYSERRTKRHWPVILGAPKYMDYTIWSHWTTEYTKLLILLAPYREDGGISYCKKAQKNIDVLSEKIVKFGGYPELYDQEGNPYKTSFYKSVLRCSWVVGFEQAKWLLEHL